MDSFGLEPEMFTFDETPEEILQAMQTCEDWEPPEYVSLPELDLTHESAPLSSTTFDIRDLYYYPANEKGYDTQNIYACPYYPPGAAANLPMQTDDGEQRDGGGQECEMVNEENVMNATKKDDSLTLDEFWNEAGKDWDKLKLSSEESRHTPQEDGLAGCETGLDCYTCGTRIDIPDSEDEDSIIKNILAPGRCTVCGCYN